MFFFASSASATSTGNGAPAGTGTYMDMDMDMDVDVDMDMDMACARARYAHGMHTRRDMVYLMHHKYLVRGTHHMVYHMVFACRRNAEGVQKVCT